VKGRSRGREPELFLNRELSWLEFNGRVLEEAEDPVNPLLERLKFVGIVASKRSNSSVPFEVSTKTWPSRAWIERTSVLSWTRAPPSASTSARRL